MFSRGNGDGASGGRVSGAGSSSRGSNGAIPLGKQYQRAALFLARAARERRFGSVICASCGHGEGTTTAVLHIAHELQTTCSLRVLVIELNRQRPVLGRMLNPDPSRPLVAAASGHLSGSDYIHGRTPSGVALLPAADLPPLESSEAEADLNDDRVQNPPGPAQPLPRLVSALKQILTDAEKSFDMVLLDSPPILEESETLIAGALVPRLILVVEAERTSLEVIDRARQELAAVGIQVVGAILSKQRQVIPRWIYRWLVR